MGRPTTMGSGLSADIEKTMAPSTLDLFFLTFNCAKNLINVGVFASHLYGALSQNATRLPDLVAFSLQEVAPMSYAFIGSYFLNPYYARYEEALNLAAARLFDEGSDGSEAGAQPPSSAKARPRPYTLVRAKNVGMTAILLFARDHSFLQSIEEAECGFGAADMGNKGAVGLRASWGDPSQHALGRTTEVTLVATHLAAMEWNLKKRNANWRSIASSLLFANPHVVLPGLFPASTNSIPSPDRSGAVKKGAESSESSEAEADDAEDTPEQPLLRNGDLPLTSEQLAALRDISIFKPTSHLFIAGDLNYRISASTPPPLSTFPSFDPASETHYSNFFSRDQLTHERLAGRAFQGMQEAPLLFGPTYKYDILSSPEGAVNEAAVRAGTAVNGVPEVPWKFAPHRWPGWCDRVLYLGLPEWVSKKKDLEVQTYDSLPVVRTSDHRPVFLRINIPLLTAKELTPPKGGLAEQSQDPRVNPPVEVDVHAWERRAAARRKEFIVGWSAFLWSTREGALVLATLLALLVGAWYLWSVWM